MYNISLKKRKTLILTQTDPNVDTMFKSWIKCKLNAEVIFKPVSRPLRAIRRIVATKMPANFLSVWLNDWKKELKKYDTIILHASELTNHLPEYIHRINPDIRIIYWYWNPVNKNTIPQLVTDENVEFWTFNQKDRLKYNMNYNIQYYNESAKSDNLEIKYDVFFIGHDKGRGKYIKKLQYLMEKKGLRCNFRIIPDSSDKFIPYDSIRKELSMSKAILEINQSGQDGYTLRALESLFLKKKLITNNVYLNKADFYFKDNIYIIGESNAEDIKKFIDVPYNHKADSFIKKYTVDAWFSNFFAENKQ